MKIRKATIKDLNEIRSLTEKFQFETNRNWRKLLTSEKTTVYLIADEGKIIGLTGITKNEWNSTIQILDIFVHPDYRGEGLAQKLVNHDIEEAKKTGFRCLIAEAPSLNAALRLYEKMGFRKCGYNDRYYSNKGKEICIWMSYDLK